MKLNAGGGGGGGGGGDGRKPSHEVAPTILI